MVRYGMEANAKVERLLVCHIWDAGCWSIQRHVAFVGGSVSSQVHVVGETTVYYRFSEQPTELHAVDSCFPYIFHEGNCLILFIFHGRKWFILFILLRLWGIFLFLYSK